MKRTLQSCFLSLLAAAAGLCAVLALGRVSWQIGSGVPGILIGAVVAGGAAWLMRLRCNVPASIFASGFGAAVACYLTIAAAEILPPGSNQWILEGGLYGAARGLPLAFILGPLGLIETGVVANPANPPASETTAPTKTAEEDANP